MQIVRIGLDLAKYVFEIHGVDEQSKTVVRKTLRRHAVSTFFANLPPCLVGMEASNGAHFWAKALSDLGHVRDRPGNGDSAGRCGRRQKLVQEWASVCGVAWPCSQTAIKVAAAPDYSVSANVEIAICARC